MPDFTITSNNPEGLIQQLRAIQQTGCGALTKECWAIAAQIEEQVKPAIEEPTEFGSVIWATSPDGEHKRWFQTAYGAEVGHPWVSELDLEYRRYDELTDVEVLRIGVWDEKVEGFCTCYPNEKAPDCGVSEHRREARIYRDPIDDAPEDERPDVAPEETDDYKLGVSDTTFNILTKLRVLRSEAITSERKNAYDVAIKTVEAMQP